MPVLASEEDEDEEAKLWLGGVAVDGVLTSLLSGRGGNDNGISSNLLLGGGNDNGICSALKPAESTPAL